MGKKRSAAREISPMGNESKTMGGSQPSKAIKRADSAANDDVKATEDLKMNL